MEIDTYLSAGTRWVGSLRLRGAWHLVQPLRRFFAPHYRDSDSPYTLIHNFDGDLKLRLNPASYINNTFYWLEKDKVVEKSLLEGLLKPVYVFCDVGANIGELTLLAAKRLPAGKVLAFEPADSVYRQLLHNVHL